MSHLHVFCSETHSCCATLPWNTATPAPALALRSKTHVADFYFKKLSLINCQASVNHSWRKRRQSAAGTGLWPAPLTHPNATHCALNTLQSNDPLRFKSCSTNILAFSRQGRVILKSTGRRIASRFCRFVEHALQSAVEKGAADRPARDDEASVTHS